MKRLGCCEPCWRRGVKASAVTQVDTTQVCGGCAVATPVAHGVSGEPTTGTQRGALIETRRRGKQPQPERNARILKLRNMGITPAALSARFGLSRQTIHAIVSEGRRA